MRYGDKIEPESGSEVRIDEFLGKIDDFFMESNSFFAFAQDFICSLINML